MRDNYCFIFSCDLRLGPFSDAESLLAPQQDSFPTYINIYDKGHWLDQVRRVISQKMEHAALLNKTTRKEVKSLSH